MTDETWTDEAVLRGDRDTLGRLAYARRAADLIHRTHSFESSAVFGLSGPWGSGKTSLVNFIVEELEATHPEWVIARFTPWATSDIAGLLDEFYASLAGALPKKRGKQARRALAVTASVAAPAATLIPIAGGVAAEGVKAAASALSKPPPWQVAFKRASDELKELQTPILVVVDDIDRLHADELMALLKVVRLLGRFDGVQYLLAYDDGTLYRSMTAASAVSPHDGSAERFMEKIVQYPMFVPPLLPHQQLARLNAGLAAVTRSAEGGHAGQRLSGLVDCFLELLTTPRAIDRYVAQLHHHVPLLPHDEVDDEDVQLLTLVRVSFPALFNAIPRYRNGLIAGHTGEMKPGSRSSELEPFDITPLLDLVPTGHRDAARRLLISLFPKVREKGQISTYASQSRQSVQHEEYFDRYFAMGILDHDVSDAAVVKAVKAACNGEPAQLRELLVATSEDVRGLVLSKGTSQEIQPSTDEGRINLTAALAGVANELPSDDSGPFSALDQTLTWIAELFVPLDRATSPEAVGDVLGHLVHTGLRVRAWARVRDKIDRVYRDSPPSWYTKVTNDLVQEAADGFLAHLKAGDDAPTNVAVGYQVHFVLRHDAARLRERVVELIEADDVDVSVLASRIVSVRTVVGSQPDWTLSPDFDQETFNQLAPARDDPWYHLPMDTTINIRDISWANRRRYAAGRVNVPPATESGVSGGDEMAGG